MSPSLSPTSAPTISPSSSPTMSPSISPTSSPTTSPTEKCSSMVVDALGAPKSFSTIYDRTGMKNGKPMWISRIGFGGSNQKSSVYFNGNVFVIDSMDGIMTLTASNLCFYNIFTQYSRCFEWQSIWMLNLLLEYKTVSFC